MKTQQLLNMPAPLWVYLDDLRATGLYGNSISGVIRSLVRDGVQRAIGDGLIRLKDFTPDQSVGRESDDAAPERTNTPGSAPNG